MFQRFWTEILNKRYSKLMDNSASKTAPGLLNIFPLNSTNFNIAISRPTLIPKLI